MSPTDLADLPFTLAALREAYAEGLRPERVAEEALRRIDVAADPGIFLHLVDRARLLAEAEALGSFDPARPLWGVPYAIKDNIDLAGAPTTAACPAFAYAAERDAFVVARLREAGALAIGKTNLDQFATGLVGVRTPYPVPRNALDPAIPPGGSSSGSAVAVALGQVAFSLGTDTAGSGRVPAGLNNIVGLKPTLGALSASGMVPACKSLDTISIFAQTVDDAHAVFRAATGFDPADPYARRIAAPPAGAAPPRLRIGVPSAESLRFDGDANQEASFKASLAALEETGASIVPIDFEPFYAVAEMLYQGAWVAERHAAMDGILRENRAAVHPITLAIVEKAEALSAADAFRGFYRLEALKRAVEPAIASVDLFCVPTFPRFVTLAELAADPWGPNSLLGVYTNFVNLLGLCGLAVPTAPRPDGRPGSVTLLAAAGRDGLLAAVGRGLERLGDRRLGATGWRPPEAAEAGIGQGAGQEAGEDEMAIVVCGAHMSGLPLNHQLTDRGGRFLRATTSAPEYRFFLLPGGPPYRPGMVRDLHGGAIAVEIWALPLSEVGSFLAGIPSPLGLGKVRLADGSEATGFVCESAGAVGAEDVTALGDWRKVMARGAA